MLSMAIVFTDPLFGVSVDVWSWKRAVPGVARTYWRPTASSVERLRRLRRFAKSRVPHFAVWSRMRRELYREWYAVAVQGARVGSSLDHLETSEPPSRRKGR
jgi:hypothetical protein